MDTVQKIIQNVEQVIVGKREVVELMMTALLGGGHVLIDDVPGVGKTGLVSAISKSVSLRFKRVQFTPDLLPSDIMGFSMFNPKKGEFEYREGAVVCQILLADEINRATPKTQSSLLEAMEEYQVTVDGVTYPLPRPFFVLATQNPVEYLGTNPLPEAQKDRFFMQVEIGYPAPEDEAEILVRHKLGNPIDKIGPVATADDILALQAEVRSVHVDPAINDYIVRVTGHTRSNPMVSLGISPRGSIDLYRAAQSAAFMAGREFVTPDDVKKIALPVLAHRVSLRQEARLKKLTERDIIRAALDDVRVPVAV